MLDCVGEGVEMKDVAVPAPGELVFILSKDTTSNKTRLRHELKQSEVQTDLVLDVCAGLSVLFVDVESLLELLAVDVVAVVVGEVELVWAVVVVAVVALLLVVVLFSWFMNASYSRCS